MIWLTILWMSSNKKKDENTFFFFMKGGSIMKMIKAKEMEDEDTKNEVAQQIKKGELVIFPTDTVYGIRSQCTIF